MGSRSPHTSEGSRQFRDRSHGCIVSIPSLGSVSDDRYVAKTVS